MLLVRNNPTCLLLLMPRILILFAHPVLEKSRVQQILLQQAAHISQVTINDLYQQYPDFDVDVEREKKLLVENDIIVWQHPFYWYSAPALLKQWMDLVLEHGWAYGKRGHALKGKKIFNAISSGGSRDAYRQDGYNKHTVQEFLRPFERTAELCRMQYWPPFWVPGVHQMEPSQIEHYGQDFRSLLLALRDNEIPEDEILSAPVLNQVVPLRKKMIS